MGRSPVEAQDGPGHRAIAVLTLAVAPVTRALPRVRLGPAGQAAFHPPAPHGEGAEGAACLPPMRSIRSCLRRYLRSSPRAVSETPSGKLSERLGRQRDVSYRRTTVSQPPGHPFTYG